MNKDLLQVSYLRKDGIERFGCPTIQLVTKTPTKLEDVANYLSGWGFLEDVELGEECSGPTYFDRNIPLYKDIKQWWPPSQFNRDTTVQIGFIGTRVYKYPSKITTTPTQAQKFNFVFFNKGMSKQEIEHIYSTLYNQTASRF